MKKRTYKKLTNRERRMTGDHILANPAMAKMGTVDINDAFRAAFPDHVWVGDFPMSYNVIVSLFKEVDVKWAPPWGLADSGTHNSMGRMLALEEKVQQADQTHQRHWNHLSGSIQELRERLSSLERQLGVELPPLNLRRNGSDEADDLGDIG